MAEAIVCAVLQTLGQPIIQEAILEAKYLSGVNSKVEDAKRQLTRIGGFLKDADARARRGDETVRLCVLEITDAAYELENVVATFVLRQEAADRKGWSAWLIKIPMELHKVGSKIDGISNRISQLTTSLQAYGVMMSGESSPNQRLRELRQPFAHVPEHDFLGFAENIKQLVERLTNPASGVVPICGIGGSGKTTLAKEVYHRREVRTHFHCFAWVYVSPQFQKREIWKGILFNLLSPSERKEIKDMPNDEAVVTKLHQVLQQNKCLVVLDDVWTKQAWDMLKPAFPENTKILITTRREDVAEHAQQKKRGCVCVPQTLDDEETWELLRKKASYLESIKATNPSDYEEMKKLGNKMLKHYGGLPLAVVVLGGLLSEKQTLNEWETLHENVEELINNGESIGEREDKGVLGVLGQSYDELPYQLKPCFLHLANFPEDSEINVKELCRLWTAEGFVLNENEAHKCLMALVRRGMVQVGKRSSIVGRIKTCRMHDLMRDLCLEKARNENFLSFLSNFQEVEGSGVSTRGMPTGKVRRLAVHSNKNIVSELLPLTNNRDQCLRSLICFVSKQELLNSRDLFKPLFSCFYMLRVLKFENILINDPNGLPEEIGELIHLRYFSLRNLQLYLLPSSMTNLRCLETLDLRGDGFMSLGVLQSMNNVISKLDRLRHLYLPKLRDVKFFDRLGVQLGIVKLFRLRLGNLKSLETLVNFDTRYCKLNDLSKLTKLTKLRISTEKSLGEIRPASNLQSLNLSKYGVMSEDIEPFLSSYLQIQKLKLDAKLVRLQENILSPNLVKATLRRTHLEVDPMPILGTLSKLRVLALVYDAYEGKKMVCCKDSFPQLEYLYLEWLPNLVEWRVEEGALSKLCHLKIRECRRLESYPDGLRNITTLKEIEIMNASEGFKRSFDQKGGDEDCPDEIESAN